MEGVLKNSKAEFRGRENINSGIKMRHLKVISVELGGRTFGGVED